MSRNLVVPQDYPHPCPATGCLRSFKTAKGLNTHLSNARSCAWYRKGKISELRSFYGEEGLLDDDDEWSYTYPEADPAEVLEDFHRDLFQFIPLHASAYRFGIFFQRLC
jgi:hypothetical protein